MTGEGDREAARDTTGRGRRSPIRPQVVLLGIVSLLNDTSSEMIFPLLPLFLTGTLGASPIVLGIIEGFADAVSSILKLVAGIISDRLGRRKPLIVTGYGLAAASRALIAAATAWPAVFLARLVDRTGKGLRSAPRDALIAEVTPPEHRGRAFGFHRALDHVGAVVGPLIATVLLSAMALDIRTVFYVALVPAVLSVTALAFLREAPVERPSPPSPESTRLPRSFFVALVPIALFHASNASDAFLILQASRAGVATAVIPVLWGAHHVLRSALSTHAGARSDRTSRRRWLAAGWILYAAIYAVFPAARSTGAFFALFIVYALPFALTEGAERAWIASYARVNVGGRAFGAYHLTAGLSTLVGTLLFGVLYEEISPAVAFFTSAALAVAAAAAITRYRTPVESGSAPPSLERPRKDPTE